MFLLPSTHRPALVCHWGGPRPRILRTLNCWLRGHPRRRVVRASRNCRQSAIVPHGDFPVLLPDIGSAVVL